MMKIIVRATGLELTDPIRTYVINKLEHLSKFVDDNASIDVEVAKTTSHHHKGEVYKTEGNLNLGGKLLRGEAYGEDLYVTVDEVKEELIREVKNYKTKKESLFLRGARKAKKLLHLD